jgi:hypothetical protein
MIFYKLYPECCHRDIFSCLLFRHACNIAIKDLHGMVLKSLIDIPVTENPDLEGQQLLVPIKKVCK